LGQDLSGWPDWNKFVGGLHPKLLFLAGVKKAALLRDPGLLRALDGAIQAELERRLTAGVSDGQRDLTDPLGKVKRRQQTIARKIMNLQQSSSEQQRQLESIFPDLRAIAKRQRR
jgi:hypothetical protein